MNLICKIFGHNKKNPYWMITHSSNKKTKVYGCSRCKVIVYPKKMEYSWYQMRPIGYQPLTLKKMRELYKKANKV